MIVSLSTQRRQVNFSVDLMPKGVDFIRHGWDRYDDHWLLHTSIGRVMVSLSGYQNAPGGWW